MVSYTIEPSRLEISSFGAAQSMMFQFEGADAFAVQAPTSKHESAIKAVDRLARCRTVYERQLKDDVIRFVRQANQEEPGQPLDIVDLACALVSVGHQVKGVEDCSGADIIVECAFRSHFCIPCATKAYLAILERVPEIFVGTASHMLPLVEIVTHELARAFAENGITMPPWRSAQSVMSKWSPQRATDRLPSSAEASPPSIRTMRDPAPEGHLRGTAQALGQTRSGNQRLSGRSSYGTGSLGLRSKGGGSPVLSVKFGFASPHLPSHCSSHGS